ncbi:hypothetical protein Salat_0392500 [Sesamum alatum]|uniref:CCHC-type domain-containing protein n=1 Tax=Sesamum alatum TaxID=300844 RepID=A0AAE1Z256_9LAMI|nr:hypothetical protein Salat_0392500 [Sesamum alatum]
MATESSFVQPSVPKFDGYYDHWAMLMENFLRSKEYWSVVENGIPAAAEEEVHALKISSGDQFGGRDRGRGGYRGRGRGRGRQNFDKSTVECFNCHKLGHFQWECPTKEVNYTEVQEEMLLMAFVDVDVPIKMDTWFLDSGCSNHMCGKKDYFSEIDEHFSDTVKLGDNRSVVVAGKGNVRLKVNDVVQIITGVFYVPQLRNNLLSVGQLQEKGLSFLFQHEKCKVYHPEREWDDHSHEVTTQENEDGLAPDIDDEGIDSSNSSTEEGSTSPIEERDRRQPDGTVELVHCNTQEQLADIMTKPLKLDVFLKLRGLLGVCADTEVN